MEQKIKLTSLPSYAKEKGIARQSLYLNKSLTIIEPPLYALYKGKYVRIDSKQKFIVEAI